MLSPKTFKCDSCAECCKAFEVKLFREDIERIKKAGHDGDFFLEPDMISRKPDEYVLRKQDGQCVFLGKKKGKYFCRIYEIRPKICRKYPFFGKKIKSCKPSELFPNVQLNL